MFREEIENYREPTYKRTGLLPAPPDFSTDNGVLFSVMRYVFLKCLGESTFEDTTEIRDLIKLHYEHPTLLRYPLCQQNPTSWDDIVAAGAVSIGFAAQKAAHTARNGNIGLRRFFFLRPFLKMRSGGFLTFWESFLLALPFWFNCFQTSDLARTIQNGINALRLPFQLVIYEPVSETSGKQLLFLMAWSMDRSRANYFAWDARQDWVEQMESIYGASIDELIKIYYTYPEHPFRKWATHITWRRNFYEAGN